VNQFVYKMFVAHDVFILESHADQF